MAQRHQNGHLRKAKRRSGPVWEFLWREMGIDGKRHQHTLVVGPVREFRTERDALAQIQVLRTNINRDSFPASALLTFSGMADHYRETELVSGNKTAKTQEIYRVYLSRWIEPRWGCEYLHNIKPVQVEGVAAITAPGRRQQSKNKKHNVGSLQPRNQVRAHRQEPNQVGEAKGCPCDGPRASGSLGNLPVV